MSHVLDVYLRKILSNNTPATREFERYLSHNGNYLQSVRNDCNGAIKLFMSVGVQEQEAVNRCGDGLAAGLFATFVDATPGIHPHIHQNEGNFIRSGKDRLNRLKQNIERANAARGGYGNNNGGGGNYSYSFGNDQQPETSMASRPGSIGGDMLMSMDLPDELPKYKNTPAEDNYSYGDNKQTSNYSYSSVGTVSESALDADYTEYEPILTKAVKTEVKKPTIVPHDVDATIGMSCPHYHAVPIDNSLSIEDMKLSYPRHERNAEFYDSLIRHNKLIPETKLTRINDTLVSLDIAVDYVDNNVKDLRTKFIEVSKKQHDIKAPPPAITLRDSLGVFSIREVTNAMETTVMAKLGDQCDVNNLCIRGAVTVLNSYFAEKALVEPFNALAGSANIVALADGLTAIKHLMPEKMWCDIDRTLTNYLNVYLNSTIPLSVKIGSFIEDAGDLYMHMNQKIDFDSVGQEFEVHSRMAMDLLSHMGAAGYDEPNPVEADGAGDAILGRVFVEPMQYFAVLRLNAADIAVVPPVIAGKSIQPMGALVDPVSLPELHKLLDNVLNEAGKAGRNEAYVITNDNFLIRISLASLLNGIIADIPVVIA